MNGGVVAQRAFAGCILFLFARGKLIVEIKHLTRVTEIIFTVSNSSSDYTHPLEIANARPRSFERRT